MDDKQAIFDAAVDKFCELAVPENVVTKHLANAFTALTKLRPSWPCPTNLRDPQRQVWEDEKNNILKKLWYKNGIYMTNVAIIWYIRDAIEIDRLRKDEYAGQAALLFAPDTWHIEALRHVIYLIKDSEFKSPEGSPAHNAAIEIENRLNEVQQCNYLSKIVKRDRAELRVYGYSTGNAYGGIPASGKAILARIFGENEDKRAILEMTSEGFIPHLLETNIFFGMGFKIADVRIIKRNGEVAMFNLSGKTPGAFASFENDWKHKMDLAWKNDGVRQVLTSAQLELLEDTIIPEFVATHSPLVKILTRIRD